MAPTSNWLWLAVVEYECIQSELSKDMCSYLKEPYGKKALFLQLSHHTDIQETSDCTCTVPENSSIVIVHYRSSCKGNVFVNAKPLLPWANASIGIFNYSLNISETKTKVTFSTWNCTTELLWIRVFKPINSSLCCNRDSNATETNATTASVPTGTWSLTEHISSTSTPKDESTLLHKSTTEIKQSPTTSSETTKDSTTGIPLQSTDEITSDSIEMPSVSMIAGISSGIAFVVLTVTVVCLVIKRKRSVPHKADEGDKAYINVNFNNEKNKVSSVTSGVYNLSFEDQNMHDYRKGDADEHEYTLPFDVTVKPPDAKETEKVTNVIANVNTNSKNIYEEPKNGPTGPESRSQIVIYPKPLKLAAAESPHVKCKFYEDLNIKNLSDVSEYSHLASFSLSKRDDSP